MFVEALFLGEASQHVGELLTFVDGEGSAEATVLAGRL